MDRFNVTERRSLLIRCSVTAGLLFICAFGAYAQAVTFPTDGNCSTELTPLPTAGGAVYFSGGAFIDCNGTPTLVTCYATGISMLFAPAASSVQFSIRNFFPFNEEISVDAPSGRLTYLIGPGSTQLVSIQGDNIAGIAVGSVDFHLGVYGISALSVEQPPPSSGFVQFDLPSTTATTSDQAKILLSKAALDIGYPSSLQ